MHPDPGTPIGHREMIRQMEAEKARANRQRPEEQKSSGQQHCRITAFRHETTGQFYAMSHEDRVAFNAHCEGIIEDFQPANYRERWLATSIAEDQWRLNRARALESNIFAIGMSSPMIDVDAGSPEADAAISQARVWLADGKKLQMLALYEQRIRRSIEKNEKQLKELQTERKAEYNKALEEAKLLAQLDISEGIEYVQEENGFGFSSAEITRLARRELRLQEATQHRKRNWLRTSKHPKAA
jgi:hypothetical protein